MCGIAGVYHYKNSKTADERTLVAMRDTLVHRGPDDAGIYLSPDRKVGLGTRRLKIIDLSPAGHMPMTDASGRAWITYNGEIYNFQDLREELKTLGYSFKSKGDTEVILNAYLAWGPDFVKRLNGMFAFVIWDKKRELLFAVRDHMGIKPFYYALQNGSFYFGSEIKAILAHPDVPRELDEETLSHYLTFSSTPAPRTLFRGIRKLTAGHSLTITKDGAVNEIEYWNPARNASRRDAGGPSTEAEYIEEVRFFLRDSIRRQMVSDVPFGCFLSGGIDSSTNAKLMSEALGHPVETFSVGYRDFPTMNEFAHSRETAKSLGIVPHELLLGESHFADFLERYAHHFDDPNGDPASFPIFWLSKFTRDSGVTVVQIGEGSDELFAGYEVYLRALRAQERWGWLKHVRGIANLGLAFLAEGPRKEFARRMIAGGRPFWGLATAFGDRGKSSDIVESWYRELENRDARADLLKQMTYVELKHRLPEFLLARAERMTMAHSVEGRVPFLDTRLVELAFNTPQDIKLKGGTTKYVLKKAVEGIIPRETIARKKRGFGTPISEWLRTESPLSKQMENMVMASKLKNTGLLDYEQARNLFRIHRSGKPDQSFKLWNLITLSLWYDRWFG
ncbi:MAG: asparagine synthase (glutamine-hydrolyzing) [Candidatus Brennerbacteria bacterium]|nr:asparagine synthase (glutamine-hydrolyzing) [Candidatus Brennerbacteria bacterium]